MYQGTDGKCCTLVYDHTPMYDNIAVHMFDKVTGLHVEKAYTSLGTFSHNVYTTFLDKNYYLKTTCLLLRVWCTHCGRKYLN